MFIDTHCHIDDEIFTDKEKIIAACINNSVEILINSGSDVKSSELSKKLSEKFPSVYYSVGVHPEHAESFTRQTVCELSRIFGDKCVAIGEIGLDYHYTPFDKEKQAAAFVSQIKLADKLRLPIVVHSRDAHADTLKIIKENLPEYGGTMHCFSGSKEIAKEYLDLGFYLSFGGTATFKNAAKTVEVLKYVPIERVLTETDSPYLSPEPKRGKVNSPENVPIICAKIAEIKNIGILAVENAVDENAHRLFTKLK